MRINRKDFVQLVILIVFGYMVFHSHRWGKDCWLCQYRGLAAIAGVMTSAVVAHFEQEIYSSKPVDSELFL